MVIPTAFATENAAEQKNGISNFSFEDAMQPQRVGYGYNKFNLYGSNLYLNVNNSAHPGTVQSGDAIIVWSDVGTAPDQKWFVQDFDDRSCYIRSGIYLDYAFNINHIENKCTLMLDPEANITNGKNDSLVMFYTAGDNTVVINLRDWPSYSLTNSIPTPGYTSYWTVNPSRYVSSAW